jgi:hypothetical protein
MLEHHFAGLVPARPYCADSLDFGLLIRSREVALRRRHIQFNGPAAYRWMLHDLDYRGAYCAHRDANLPPPNVIAINRDNGHAHSAYLLGTPVARHAASRIGPLRLFAAVELGVARRLNADRRYVGLIAKNPLHEQWSVEWRRNEPYSLEELREWLWERDMRPEPVIDRTSGAGRNVTIFDELRHHAYREVRLFKAKGPSIDDWLSHCTELASTLNRQFPTSLPLSEIRAISKSVAKWTWRRFSVEKFAIIQSHRAQTRTRRHLKIVQEIKAHGARANPPHSNGRGAGCPAQHLEANRTPGMGGAPRGVFGAQSRAKPTLGKRRRVEIDVVSPSREGAVTGLRSLNPD